MVSVADKMIVKSELVRNTEGAGYRVVYFVGAFSQRSRKYLESLGE
jgi:hypothetical protein